jgi:lipopolysaccharide export system protein LptC
MNQATPMRRADPRLAPAGEPAGGRDGAFRTAKRHSRRVRVLRWALPAAALGGLAIIMLVVWLDPLRLYRNLPVEFGRISITDNKLTIEAPKLTGFTQDRRPYSVTAESAAQDLGSPNVIELAGILGQVELANRGETEMRAKNGVYDMKLGTLNLSNGIEIGATGGYKVLLQDALVEVRKGRIVTDKPVRAVFPDGTLDAQRVEIFEHGDRVRFGGVVMTFRMPPQNSGDTERSSADQAPAQRSVEAKR